MRFGENAVCNLCGHLCSLSDSEGSVQEHNAGLQDATVSGGYHSTAGNGYGALDDCMTYKFNLCEFCLDWLFERFVVPVEMSDYMNGGTTDPEPFRPAAQRVREDAWRRFKDEFFSESEKRAKDRGVK